MFKQFLMMCAFALNISFAQGAVIYVFDLSPANIFHAGDSVSISFADTTDFSSINGTDLLSWDWNLNGTFKSSSNFMYSDLKSLFSYSGGNLFLTVGQTGSYAYLHSNLSFASQFGQGYYTSLYTFGGSQHVSPGTLTFTAVRAGVSKVPEPQALTLASILLFGFIAMRRRFLRY